MFESFSQDTVLAVLTIGAMGVGIILTLRDQNTKLKDKQTSQLIESIRNQIAPLNIKVDKNQERTVVQFNEREKLITSMKGDLDSLYSQVNDLEKMVAEHKGILQVQNPLVVELRHDITGIREKLEEIRLGEDVVDNGIRTK